MKAKNSLMGMLCLINKLLKIKHILAVVLVFMCISTKAQFHKPSNVTVRMGETLPSSFYETVHQAINARTGESTTVKLVDYKDKLIILDFWATWCGPCIYSLAQLDSLKLVMNNDDYIVIPVTYQSAKEAMPAFDKFKWGFVSIVGDSTLCKIFPHTGIPYMAWIKDGKVFGFPRNGQATAENIMAVVKGGSPKMDMKADVLYLDPTKSLFTKGNGDSKVLFSDEWVEITEENSLYQYEPITIVNGDSLILYGNNITIEQLFRQAYRTSVFRPYFTSFNLTPKWKDTAARKPFLQENGMKRFGISLKVNTSEGIHNAYLKLQKALNEYFGNQYGVVAKLEDQGPETYAVLKHLNDNKKDISKLKGDAGRIYSNLGKAYRSYYNFPFHSQFKSSIQSRIRQFKGLLITVPQLVDSTDIENNLAVSFTLPARFKDLSDFDKWLAGYGLKVEIKKEMVPAMVLEKVVHN